MIFSCLGVTRRAAGNGEQRPEFALGQGAIEHNELAVERLAVAILRTAKPTALAGSARADGHAQRGDGAVRNDVKRLLCTCVLKLGIVLFLSTLLLCYERLLGWR